MRSVDYRLARRALLRQLDAGVKSRYDVCDAHPELMRAARFIGEDTGEECPICGDSTLREVFFAYGKELKRENGRVRRRADLDELRSRFGEFVCYVVEVCTDCSWNHLVRSFVTGRRYAV